MNDNEKLDVPFIDDFIKQSRTGNLKTKGLYPEYIQSLKIKISFGQGTPAAIPWISFLGPEMFKMSPKCLPAMDFSLITFTIRKRIY